MKKALIICAAGMSSSMIAKKTTDALKEKGFDIELEATSTTEGVERIEKDEFDLYLVSPQTRMYFDNLKKSTDKVGKPIVNIPPQAYIPIPMGINKMTKLVEENIQ